RGATSDQAGRSHCAGQGAASDAAHAAQAESGGVRGHARRPHASGAVTAAVIAYLDTSAIMALLLRVRPGHEAAESEWEEADEVATVHLAPVEVRAALVSEQAGGRLRPSRFRTAKALWAQMWPEIAVVLADEALVTAASQAAEHH